MTTTTRKLIDLLQSIQQSPGMWFSISQPRSLALIQAFITGFERGRAPIKEPLDFSCFSRWIAARYREPDGPGSGFCLILEKMKGDETAAFNEFFELLPEFIKDLETIGPEGIESRYQQVMAEIRRHF